MKKIVQIAKNELYSLFYSPIAWIMMIVFSIMTGSGYIGALEFFVARFDEGTRALPNVQDLTNNIVYSFSISILRSVLSNLYLYFPLVTMGLISREKGNGTIRLLYSSPVSIREVVWGKYLSMVVYTGCFIFLITLSMIALSFTIVHPDFPQMMASVFAMFLLMMTYAAIGLFFSSLTSYQVVAAIATLVLFAVLDKTRIFWQNYEIIREVTFYLNLKDRADRLLKGLLNLRDILYFVILIGGFISFTIIKLKSATQSISRWRKSARYACVIGVAYLLAYITIRPGMNVYVDATRTQMYTISKPTQQKLSELGDGDLEVTTYCNLFHTMFGLFNPQGKDGLEERVWDPYIRFKPKIKFNYVYYYALDTNWDVYKTNRGLTIDEIVKKEAEVQEMNPADFLNEAQVSKQVNVKEEEYINFYVLKYKGRSTILRTFVDGGFFPFEDEIAAAISRLISTPPTVGFLSGNIERGPYSRQQRDYMGVTHAIGLRQSLLNQGYDFDTISLANTPSIPDSLSALVIADPRKPFSSEELSKIFRYIDKGGNLLINAEPDRKDVIKPILDKLGVSLHDGILIQPSRTVESDQIYAYQSDSAKVFYPAYARMVKKKAKYYLDSTLPVAMPGVSALDFSKGNGFDVYPLLYTDSSKSWNRLAPISEDSLQLPVSHRPNDEAGSFVTAVRLDRSVNGRQQRIIVSGDADYLSSGDLFGAGDERTNYDFGFAVFTPFTYGMFPANTLKDESIDNAFTIHVKDISVQSTLFYWVIPIIIGLFASILLIRRRRK